MTLLVSYDIENDRLRLRTANKLLEFGFLRLQLSVFAGTLPEPLWARLLLWLQQEAVAKFGPDDKLLWLPLTEHQTRDFHFLPAPPPEWREQLEPPNTLFI